MYLKRLTICSVMAWILTLALLAVSAQGQGRPGDQAPAVQGPWMDRSLLPDRRAELLVGQMTLKEKISLLHGVGRKAFSQFPGSQPPPGSLGGAGFIPGIPRLGIPDL